MGLRHPAGKDAQNRKPPGINSEGEFVTKWGTQGTGDGEFNYPDGVSVASDSSVYVSEAEGNRIQKFSPGP